MTATQRLTIQEQRILTGLGGRPWTASRYLASNLGDARKLWAELREAVGFRRHHSGWMTTDTTSPKMRKTGLPSAGVNLHAAKDAAQAWSLLGPVEQSAVAGVFGLSTNAIAAVLAPTVCAHSTPGCRQACVVAHSANAVLPRSQRSRLARSLLTLLTPEHAVTLTAHALDRLAQAHGPGGARWRVNVSDDLRWELLAPGLFHGPQGYSYTKWPVAARPGRPNLRLVYSATERWTPAQVVEMCAAGHRVAVVLDVPKSSPLPDRWAGVQVVDGDTTDDLWAHPSGVIVGLRAKAPTRELKQQMRASGFAWPVPASTPVTLRTKWAAAA